jgi:hypothetical protein
LNNLIGRKYRYPEPTTEQIFVLKSIVEKSFFNFFFECGHMVTAGVFGDLIDLETGYQNYEVMPYTVTDENRVILSGNIIIEGITHKVENKYVKCNVSLNSKSWNTTESQSICENCFNKNKMYKLKKPKEFQVSEPINVNFNGITAECANLMKSGIINQSVVLVGYVGAWHEIKITDLVVTEQVGSTANDMKYYELKNSDLSDFKKHIETHKFSLVSLGIIESEKPKTNYIDFFSLAKNSKLTYLDIEKLYHYLVSEKLPSSKQDMSLTIKYIDNNSLSVNDYINNTNAKKYEIINGISPKNPINMKKVLSPVEPVELAQRKASRANDLVLLGMKFDEFEGNFIGHGFCVTSDSIEWATDEEWNVFFDKIAAVAGVDVESVPETPETPEVPELPSELVEPATSDSTPAEPTPAGLITLESIGNLKPDRISELQGLSAKQDAIVKANPFVKIKDAKTLKQAKAAKAALLKASTETEGIEKNASKYLNAFKAMIKKIVEPAAQKTRDAHKLQADEITLYENAEALRVQAEQTAKLQKIQDRTKRLFAVPFVFNGALYQIGTLYVTPSQVETSTDEEFDVLVKQGEAIKVALDAAALVASEKDKQIAELMAKLEALTNTPEPAPAEPVQRAPVEVTPTPAPVPATEPAKPLPSTSNTAPNASVTPPTQSVSDTATDKPKTGRFEPETEYEMASPENKLLNKFDMDHASIVSMNPIPPAYIKCRAYAKYGMLLVAQEIEHIMADPDQRVKKSVRIMELCEIIKRDA